MAGSPGDTQGQEMGGRGRGLGGTQGEGSDFIQAGYVGQAGRRWPGDTCWGMGWGHEWEGGRETGQGRDRHPWSISDLAGAWLSQLTTGSFLNQPGLHFPHL